MSTPRNPNAIPQRVYTYHHPVEGLDDPELLRIWRTSWSKCGFEPVVLNPTGPPPPELVETTPFFTANTVLPREYQLACIRRWYEFSKLDESAVLACDWDVINRGFRPRDRPGDYNRYTRESNPGLMFYILSPNDHPPCPAVTFGRPADYRRWFDWFIAQARAGNVRGDCHDEALMRRVPGSQWPVATIRYDEAPNPIQYRTWTKSSKLIHYNFGSEWPKRRSDRIKRDFPGEYT